MIYVSSACVYNSYIGETVEQFAKAGITNIELSGGTKYYEHIEADLKSLKRKYGLQYVCHAYFPPPKEDIVVNLASCNDEIYRKSIEHYEKSIQMLSKLDIEVLSIHAGFMVEVGTAQIGKRICSQVIYPKDKSYDRFVSAYQYISSLCQKEGIKLYLENNVLSEENYLSFKNENLLMMTDFESISFMRDKLQFELLLDLGHLQVSTTTLDLNYEIECEKLLQQAEWIHISHNNGITDQHLPLIKESNILKQFKLNKRKDINITLETNGRIDEIQSSIKLLEET